MKGKSVIGHACWAAVTAGAFAAGLVLDQKNSGGSAGPSVKVPPSAKSSRNVGGNAPGSSGTRGARPPVSAGAAAGQLPGGGGGGPRVLSEAEIAAVARDAFRNGNPLVRRKAFDQFLSNMTADNAQEMLVHLKENR
ncbi:MAG: hypothetical protein CMN06_05780, partial [Roseibacillus sp.]|nr:hypothetical protein [Roseibacillus sp.]